MEPVTLGLAAAALYLLTRSGGGGSDDSKEETDVSQEGGTELLADELWSIADSIGWPYSWGGGGANVPWQDGPDGVDCSGYALMCAVRLGQIGTDTPRMTAAEIANACDPVALGEQQPGDFAYWAGHVMLVASWPDDDGNSAVIGASGGDHTTHGDNPNARVKVFSSQNYRRQFVTFMRWKEA